MMKLLVGLFLLVSIQVVHAQALRKPGDNYSIPVKPGSGVTDVDLETIRTRIVSDLLMSEVNKEAVDRLIQTQLADGSWPDINYKDVSRTGFQHSQHLSNMTLLARAFKKEGSDFYQKAACKKVVSAALDYWIAHDFICENWWWNEMGTPHQMINLLLLMDTDLTEKQRTEGARIAGRANLEASGARPGGDLIQIAGMVGKQALFQRNSEILAKVITVLASEIKVSGGRGLKPDMSFHHRTDNVISTLAYGTGYANTFAYWVNKVKGTKYTLPQPALQLLVDYYLDGITQSLIYGTIPDPGALNRDITRKGALVAVGTELPENLLGATTYRKAELENLIAIRKGLIRPNLRKDYYFWHSHYYTHQRPNYYVSVRMHSNRASNMEQPHNEEGLKNHHYGDGAQFISRTGKEYDQIFPVWDWQKIPGTTVVQKADVAHWKDLARQGKNDFTGGVTDQQYGAAAFDFSSVHDPLQAKKAWFFFEKEVVSLGAGIQSSAEQEVVTTLNQCLLNGQVEVKNGKERAMMQPGKHTLQDVSWVLHDEVGYYFPNTVSLQLQNQEQSGNWRKINHHSWATDEEVRKPVFTLWLDHGKKPVNGSYQYVVVPGMKGGDMEGYVQNSGIRVLSNTVQIQAVENLALGIAQVVFYQPGQVKLSDGQTISAESPCMVMLTLKDKQVKKVAISDPTGQLKKLTISLSGKMSGTHTNWHTTWDSGQNATKIQFTLPLEGLAGKSVVAELTTP